MLAPDRFVRSATRRVCLAQPAPTSRRHPKLVSRPVSSFVVPKERREESDVGKDDPSLRRRAAQGRRLMPLDDNTTVISAQPEHYFRLILSAFCVSLSRQDENQSQILLANLHMTMSRRQLARAISWLVASLVALVAVGSGARAHSRAPVVGTVIIAHGGGPEWDSYLDSTAAMVRTGGPVAISLLMGPGAATHRFQDAVARVLREGAEEIVVVPRSCRATADISIRSGFSRAPWTRSARR
jgi:hypothetical protein